MSKTEPFIKLSQGFFDNPKIVRLTRLEQLAYIVALCEAGKANRDGEFSLKAVLVTLDVGREQLQGLIPEFWVPTENENVFVVHDFLDWNLSRVQCLKRAGVSRRNGAKNTGKKPSQVPTQDANQVPGNNPARYPDETQPGTYMGTQMATQVGTQPGTQKEPELRIKKLVNSYSPSSESSPLLLQEGVVGGERAKTTQRRKTRKPHPLPDDWQPTDSHVTTCQEVAAKYPELNITLDEAVEIFKDWAENAENVKNWNLTFTNALKWWIPKEFAKRRNARQQIDLAVATRPLPEGWEPNPQGVNLAEAAGLDVGKALEYWRNHQKSKGHVSADWDAQWRKDLGWLKNATSRRDSEGRNPDGTPDWDQAEQDLLSHLTPQHPEIVTKTGFTGVETPEPIQVHTQAEKTRENGYSVNPRGEPPF